ncbi:MAG: CDP-diacylglycerol--glycerol-3-phosphate 3-phosphatidyltransferase [Halocynthiibacter sp.]
MNWTLPNILTVMRLLAAPGVAVMFLYFNRPYADWFALLLFTAAALTDFLDGYLARAWKQITKFGTMLDPIADKAMVVIALLVISGLFDMDPWVLLPAVIIMFREVFVSGLREFLGDRAVLLKVTRLAKWKTTAQMVAIAVLFSYGAFEYYYQVQIDGMDPQVVSDVLGGGGDDLVGLVWKYQGMMISFYGGIGLLWLASLLTLLTGLDYFIKALPVLKEDAAK